MADFAGGYLASATTAQILEPTVESIEKDADFSSKDEKDVAVEQGEISRSTSFDLEPKNNDDPFPQDPDAPEEQQLTFRAVIVGCILGGVIAASNVYLGLKTGWTFGASLFGSILGFAILKPISRLPEHLGGGYFGPKENVCCQSAATAAGSLGLLFTSGFPAAYQLGLLGESPKADIGRLITFTACCAYFGMFYAVPLRKLYVLKLKLVYPSGVAAAHTIRSLHSGATAELNARKKTRALLISFAFAITLRCVSEYAPGVLWDWHWSWTLYSIGWKWIICAESWGWVWEWTPAFIGCGMLIGLNPSYSFLGGSFLAWAIIGPAIVKTGLAFGTPVSATYLGYMSYMGMVMEDPVHHPTPRYWLLWPGTMLLLCGAFAEIFANYKMILASIVHLLSPYVRYIRNREFSEEDQIYDPIPAKDQVPWWLWGSGLVLSIFFTCLVLGLQYDQNVGVTILAIVFGFLFSFICAECAGRTNVNPVTPMGNASQLVIGGITRHAYAPAKAQLLNISGGLVACGAAYQSVDMLYDLKTAHLLGAAPRVQFYAQLAGAVVSIFTSVGMYILFSEAYPCINSLSLQGNCSFPAPDVGAFRAIASALTEPQLPIPPSSGYLAIGFGVLAFVATFIKYRFVPPRWRVFFPNIVAMGTAFILDTTTYPTAMAFGSTVIFLLRRKYPEAVAMYCFVVAAGFIAGEGLGGIIGAVLQVGKVSGNYYGTVTGCPAFEYCG